MNIPRPAALVELVRILGPSAGALTVALLLLVPITRDMLEQQRVMSSQLVEISERMRTLPVELAYQLEHDGGLTSCDGPEEPWTSDNFDSSPTRPPTPKASPGL